MWVRVKLSYLGDRTWIGDGDITMLIVSVPFSVGLSKTSSKWPFHGLSWLSDIDGEKNHIKVSTKLQIHESYMFHVSYIYIYMYIYIYIYIHTPPPPL